MGRVYDAMKRASADSETNGAGKDKSDAKGRGKKGVGKKRTPQQAAGGNGTAAEHPWDSSQLFTSSSEAHGSASTAHTESRVGSALPGDEASRAAGATLDAAGSARAQVEFVSE
ncbi:MAG TPA: hypothetical protein VM911_06210, partial [Pyrinomonadaceae bacterium]|nr:hypothetical protein [Pyrinomonadaceae bacterium]